MENDESLYTRQAAVVFTFFFQFSFSVFLNISTKLYEHVKNDLGTRSRLLIKVRTSNYE